MRSRIIAITGGLTVSAAVLLAIGWTDQTREASGDATAIVAAEIVSTDYRATHSDGPMYAVARIVKVVEGKLSPGSEVRFAESAWCGPNYKAGEHRILFLFPVTAATGAKNYYSSVRWATLCAGRGRIDYFISKESIAALSSASLETFLKDQEANNTPPRVVLAVSKADDSALMISIKLTNVSGRPLWVNPSKVSISFTANGTSHYREVEFAPAHPEGWAVVAPAESITGVIRILREEVKGRNEIILAVHHPSVYLPYNSWAGTILAAPLKLGR